MVEIVENVHRSDLEVMERASLTGKLARLMKRAEAEGYTIPETPVPASRADPEKDKMTQVVSFSDNAKVGAGRGNKGGARELARTLGRNREEVRRDLKINSLSDDAKEKARELGLKIAKVETRRFQMNQDDSETQQLDFLTFSPKNPKILR